MPRLENFLKPCILCNYKEKENQIKSSLKLRVLGLFPRFLRTLIIKYPHLKNQQTPRVSTELEVVVNLSYSFIPLKKILQKGVDRLVENPQRQKRRSNFTGACATKCPSAVSQFTVLHESI